MNSSTTRSNWHKDSRVALFLRITIICWSLLAILFGLFDLQISLALVDLHSGWAHWIENYGEVPGAVMVICSLFILDKLRIPSGTKEALLRSLGLSILVTLLIIRYGAPFCEKFEVYRLYTVYFLSMIWVLVLIIHMLLKKMDISPFQKKRNFALLTIGLAVINPLVFVQSVKLIWGRVRFRDLATDYSNYTPWYLPQGITGNFSFPSGHTAMGWMLLPLFLLIQNNRRKAKLLVGSMIVVWGVVIALGRVVIGAHYASDVLFSTGVGIVSYLLLYKQMISQPIFAEN